MRNVLVAVVVGWLGCNRDALPARFDLSVNPTDLRTCGYNWMPCCPPPMLCRDNTQCFNGACRVTCFYGDGGVGLMAGEACNPFTTPCARPIQCAFEAYDFDAKCSVEADGGTGRCCQYVKSHSMVDGHVYQWRDCGEGFVCIGGC